MFYRRMILFVCVGLVVLASQAAYAKPKVLFVESYHQGYPWSDGITKGVYETLGYKVDPTFNILDDSKALVTLKVIHMDTKLFSTLQLTPDADAEAVGKAKEAFIEKTVQQVKATIETWQPDVVIASDDNASKHLIRPHYHGATLPFVFCGVNWNADGYDFPCANVTGMVEVALIPPLVKAMKPFSKGDRIGFLGGNNTTNHKEVKHIQETFDLKLHTVLANDFDEWQQGFQRLQSEADMVIINTTSAVKGFDLAQTQIFVNENTTVPTGCVQQNETTLALIGYLKSPVEQGTWAAQTALKILKGTSPQAIPVVANRKGQIYLNMPLAAKLGVRFPLTLVKQAKLIRMVPVVAAN